METRRDQLRTWINAVPGRSELPIRTQARLAQSELGLSGALDTVRVALNEIYGRGHARVRGGSHEKEPGNQGDRPPMPDPWPNLYSGPYEMPEGTALILADIHIPGHDVRALEIALDHRPFDYVVLLGDVIDAQTLSEKFAPHPGGPRLVDEKAALRAMLHTLAWHEKPVFYYLGNHEERWWKILMRRMPELAVDPDMSFGYYFGVEEHGGIVIPTGVGMKFGKLMGFHGHEVTMNSPFTPQSPASWLYRQTGVSAFCGHYHRSNEHTMRRADGSVVGAWTLGCLCDLAPKYARRNQWNHGFAVVEFDQSGFEMSNYKIIDGRVR